MSGAPVPGGGSGWQEQREQASSGATVTSAAPSKAQRKHFTPSLPHVHWCAPSPAPRACTHAGLLPSGCRPGPWALSEGSWPHVGEAAERRPSEAVWPLIETVGANYSLISLLPICFVLPSDRLPLAIIFLEGVLTQTGDTIFNA